MDKSLFGYLLIALIGIVVLVKIVFKKDRILIQQTNTQYEKYWDDSLKKWGMDTTVTVIDLHYK